MRKHLSYQLPNFEQYKFSKETVKICESVLNNCFFGIKGQTFRQISSFYVREGMFKNITNVSNFFIDFLKSYKKKQEGYFGIHSLRYSTL